MDRAIDSRFQLHLSMCVNPTQPGCAHYCPIHVVRFMLISNLISDLITDLISDFGIASMLNYTINHTFGNKIYGMINMEAIPKFDNKSVIKSDIKFDISTKPTTWIGH